jgi:hypothetical protein
MNNHYKEVIAAFALIFVGILMLVLVMAIPVEARYDEPYPAPTEYDPYPPPQYGQAYPVPTPYIYDPYPNPEPINVISSEDKFRHRVLEGR